MLIWVRPCSCRVRVIWSLGFRNARTEAHRRGCRVWCPVDWVYSMSFVLNICSDCQTIFIKFVHGGLILSLGKFHQVCTHMYIWSADKQGSLSPCLRSIPGRPITFSTLPRCVFYPGLPLYICGLPCLYGHGSGPVVNSQLLWIRVILQIFESCR